MRRLTSQLHSLLLATLFTLTLPANAEPVDFSRTTIDGKTLSLSDYRGKWVVINFWATYCGPCLKELPMLETFHRKHSDKSAVVIGVNFELIDHDSLRRFVNELGLSFPNVQAGNEPLIPFEPLERGLPETFFVNPDGEYVDKHIGLLTYEDLLDYTGLPK